MQRAWTLVTSYSSLIYTATIASFCYFTVIQEDKFKLSYVQNLRYSVKGPRTFVTGKEQLLNITPLKMLRLFTFLSGTMDKFVKSFNSKFIAFKISIFQAYNKVLTRISEAASGFNNIVR